MSNSSYPATNIHEMSPLCAVCLIGERNVMPAVTQIAGTTTCERHALNLLAVGPERAVQDAHKNMDVPPETRG